MKDKIYIIKGITKQRIIRELNDHFEVGLTDDDARLTDELCTAYAAGLGQISEPNEEAQDEAEVEFMKAFLTDKLGIKVED